MKIYIDITNLLYVNFLSGIQRVVREVLTRILRNDKLNVVLICYQELYNRYELVDNQAFYKYYELNQGEKNDVHTGRYIDLEQLGTGDVFFDIDSVWNLPPRRSVILPKLKTQGVKLVVYVYDIIPVTHPQFCHGRTLYNFLNYIGSYVQYADLIMASTQTTLDELDVLYKQLDIPPVPGVVSWLGSDFKIQKDIDGEVNPEAVKAVEAGRYVLMVGTVEPRKNHALVLDAFDQELFEEGINVIFAGRIGWNIEEFQERIKQHPKLNEQLFHLSGMNDATIDFLYQHAYCVAFPTFNEGFGLPMIEAFQRGTPVLASDIPILREVGGDSAEYFDISDWTGFAKALKNWIANPDIYNSYVDKVKAYKPVTWDTVTETIEEALLSVGLSSKYPVPERIKQMLYLTARQEDLLASLPYVEHFMPFIEELVLCCPEFMVASMKKEYKGKLRITYITDPELLDGEELPKDHALRNFLLRCRAMRREELDDVFIMADDDYRPLKNIEQEIFLKDGKYQGYYCYNLLDWLGDQRNPSSFDQSMYKTADYLKECGYATMMYDSHMPQVIDRRIFVEMLDEDPEIEHLGFSDWSMYFNYLSTKYPAQFNSKPYVALAWPGLPTHWNQYVEQEEYLFENYYSELYNPGALFDGISQDFHEGIEQENIMKVTRYMRCMEDHHKLQAMYQSYVMNYAFQYGENPNWFLDFHGDVCEIFLPKYVAIGEDGLTRIPFRVRRADLAQPYCEIVYDIMTYTGEVLAKGNSVQTDLRYDCYEMPIHAPHGGIRAGLEVRVTYAGKEYKKRTMIMVMRRSGL